MSISIIMRRSMEKSPPHRTLHGECPLNYSCSCVGEGPLAWFCLVFSVLSSCFCMPNGSWRLCRVGLVGATSGWWLMMTTHDGCAGYRPRQLKTWICRLRQDPSCLCFLDGFRQKAADRLGLGLAGCWTRCGSLRGGWQTKGILSFSLNPA